MGMPGIIYEISKIIQFILIIILLFYFILYESQQVISNIDPCMKCMTFHVQLLKCYTIMASCNVAQGKGSHLTLKVQHKSSFNLH